MLKIIKLIFEDGTSLEDWYFDSDYDGFKLTLLEKKRIEFHKNGQLLSVFTDDIKRYIIDMRDD